MPAATPAAALPCPVHEDTQLPSPHHTHTKPITKDTPQLRKRSDGTVSQPHMCPRRPECWVQKNKALVYV